jgi:hypothetical protein
VSSCWNVSPVHPASVCMEGHLYLAEGFKRVVDISALQSPHYTLTMAMFELQTCVMSTVYYLDFAISLSTFGMV